MKYIPNIIFCILITYSIYIFYNNILKLKRNISLGKGEVEISGSKKERWKKMILLAFGQSKMINRPISGLLHLVVYIAFIIINIELIEIIIDGVFGTHRIFSTIGSIYGFLIGSFEILAISVIVCVSIFWIRRNVLRLKRFYENKMIGWPKMDANLILYFEILIMSCFLLMNTFDVEFQIMDNGNIISGYLSSYFNHLSADTMYILERIFWWTHIILIMIFLNYLYYSKHLHILLAFPNTYFSPIKNLGWLNNLSSVKKEIDIINGTVNESSNNNELIKFGASDANDLSWLQILNSYTCTECGRCTSVCPANITGKKLSPRKIMMDTRDRIEEIGRNIDRNGEFIDDNKKLLDDYITKEELWACTSCNACVEECPISINPMSIIMDMRRYVVMEESSASSEINNMMSNIENNGAPWPYNQQDRLNWNE